MASSHPSETVAAPKAAPGSSDRAWFWATAGVVLVGAALRLWRIGYELPHLLDVDSSVTVGEAARMAASGDFAPNLHRYPGGFANLLAILYRLGGVDTLAAQHLVGRLVSAFFGIATAAATWKLCRNALGAVGTFLAVALTTLSVEGVTASRAAGADTIVAALVMGVVVVLAAPEVSFRRALGAGVLAGLATSMKYNGAYVCVFIAVYLVILGVRSRTVGRAVAAVGVAGAAAIGAFIAAAPWFLPDIREYLYNVRVEAFVQRGGQLGHTHLGFFDYLWSMTTVPSQPWLGTSLLYNAGPVMLAAALAASIWALAGRRGWNLGLYAGFVVAYLALMSGPGRVKAVRFLLPVLPLLYVLVAAWIERWSVRLAARMRGGAIVPVVLAALILFVPLYRTARFVAAYARPSTITETRDWLAKNVPPGSRLFISPMHLNDLLDMPYQIARLPRVAARQYNLPEGVGLSGERNPIYEPGIVEWITSQQVSYVLLNEYFEGMFAPTPENRRWYPRSVAGYQQFLVELRRRARLVHRIVGFTDGRCGPDVDIYRIGP